MNIVAITFLILLSLTCTNKSSTKVKALSSDTANLFKAVFDENFLSRNMPGYGAPGVGQNSIFGDTILLEFNDSLDVYIPESLSSHHLRRLTRDSICSLLKQQDNDTLRFPNFIRITKFQKIDSGYNINLQATCVMLSYSNPKLDKVGPCIFGMLCGGGVSIDAIKRQDTFSLIRKGGWSD